MFSAVDCIIDSTELLFVRSTVSLDCDSIVANPSIAAFEFPCPAADPTTLRILLTCAAAARLFGFFTFK